MTPGGKLTSDIEAKSTPTTFKGSPLKMATSCNAAGDKGGPPATAKSSRDKLKDKQQSGGLRSGGGGGKGSSPGKKGKEIKKEVNLPSTSEESSEAEQPEVTFEDYTELCERVAKTMYYVNPRQKCTPRPSLPLTILAVDTFSKYGRKDTLEFLDIDMAAEIGRNACVSPTALVFALVYLERLSVNNPGYLKTVKPSELFVVSLLVASKFVLDDDEDLGVFNDEWATSANMELKRVNQLEIEFLTAIDWQVNISSQDYSKALSKVEAKLSLNQGIKRGWFTYTELQNSHLLSSSLILPLLYQKVSEVISGLCVMYTTFFCTVITTSALTPYLLSLSTKLVLISSMLSQNSFSTSSSSCLSSEDTLGNVSLSMSIPLSQTTSTLPPNHPLHPRIGGVPASTHNLLQSLEEQENQTEISDQISSQISSHKFVNNHRVFQTANANFQQEGHYSYKCEGVRCDNDGGSGDGEEDDALGKVKRVLENLLKQSYHHQSYHSSHHSHQQSQLSSLKCVGGGVGGGGGFGFGNALCAI